MEKLETVQTTGVEPTRPHHPVAHWTQLRRRAGNSLFRNSFFIMATTLVTSGLGYIYWTAAARVFSADAVGLASALISAVNLVSALSLLGLPSVVIDLLSGQRSTKSWSAMVEAAMFMVAATGLVCGAGMWLLLPVLSSTLQLSGEGAADVVLLVGLVAIGNILAVLDGVFKAERASHFLFARNVAFSASKIPLLFLPLLLPLLHRNSFTILLSWVLATIISLVLSLVWCLRRLGYRPQLDVGSMWRQSGLLGRRVGGNYLISIGGTMPMYLLPVIVATRLTTTDAAYFYTTWMVGGIFFMVSSSISSALFAEGSVERTSLPTQLRSSIRLVILYLAPLSAVCFFWGKAILGIFGVEYAQYGFGILLILVVSAVPDAVTNLAITVLRVRRHIYIAGALNIGMSVVTLVLAWILLPLFGINGAGWAWLIGQSCGTMAVLGYLAIHASRNMLQSFGSRARF